MVGLFVCLFAFPGVSAPAQEVFLESDDYEERKGPIGVFLGDEDYALMVEDIERNGVKFDWGWARTPDVDNPAPPPERKGKLLDRMRLRRPKRIQKPNVLGFHVSQIGPVHVPPIKNFAGIFKGDQLEQFRTAFLAAVEALGLTVTDDRSSAASELGLAVLDQMRSQFNGPVPFGISIKPFLLIELRWLDLASGDNLLLLRNRKHGGDMEEAAMNYADDLVMFLR
ncbi:MAG TPA: hypothetical protein PKO05_02980 [Thermoanaerobaculia bacterium]|jgi:hypothetical protein|nr:hypothetical protein [Thermoanaerobaculia bacterium]